MQLVAFHSCSVCDTLTWWTGRTRKAPPPAHSVMTARNRGLTVQKLLSWTLRVMGTPSKQLSLAEALPNTWRNLELRYWGRHVIWKWGERGEGAREETGEVSQGESPPVGLFTPLYLPRKHRAEPRSTLMHFSKQGQSEGEMYLWSIKMIIKSECMINRKEKRQNNLLFMASVSSLTMIFTQGCFMLHSLRVMSSFRPFSHSMTATYWSWNR